VVFSNSAGQSSRHRYGVPKDGTSELSTFTRPRPSGGPLDESLNTQKFVTSAGNILQYFQDDQSGADRKCHALAYIMKTTPGAKE
jgi:hypothetical protein